jgi:hypothetical protein
MLKFNPSPLLGYTERNDFSGSFAAAAMSNRNLLNLHNEPQLAELPTTATAGVKPSHVERTQARAGVTNRRSYR